MQRCSDKIAFSLAADLILAELKQVGNRSAGKPTVYFWVWLSLENKACLAKTKTVAVGRCERVL